jgi:serine/threonine protein kinase
MAPEIHSNQASTKSDVYSFGVLLIQLVNGSPLTLDGDEIHIRNFIQWVREVHEKENGFQQIFDVAINNSIVGFDQNEAKLLLQISLQCIKVNFVPNLLFYRSICGQENFKNQNHGFDVIFETT